MTTIIPQAHAESTPPTMFVTSKKAGPEAVEAVNAFVLNAESHPEDLLDALFNNGRLSTPDRLAAESYLGDPSEQRQWALGVLATFFEQRLDECVAYDRETAARITEAREADEYLRNIESVTGRTLPVSIYLGRVLENQTTALTNRQAA